jgi:hypothetical protein
VGGRGWDRGFEGRHPSTVLGTMHNPRGVSGHGAQSRMHFTGLGKCKRVHNPVSTDHENGQVVSCMCDRVGSNAQPQPLPGTKTPYTRLLGQGSKCACSLVPNLYTQQTRSNGIGSPHKRYGVMEALSARTVLHIGWGKLEFHCALAFNEDKRLYKLGYLPL